MSSVRAVAVAAAGVLLLSSCGHYADFSLPVLGPSKPGTVRLEWDVRPEPVLPRGAAQAFDGVDALNPSVVEARGGGLLNLYSGYDGRAWHTGLAVSADGLRWERRGKVLSPDAASWEGEYIAANGSVLDDGKGGYLYWYQGGRVPQIGLARSSDGVHWTRHGAPVLTTGPRGSWDERGVADPYAIRVGNTFYLYYLGQDRARRQQIGVARSADGVRWEKLRSNPVLEPGAPGEFDETGLGEPAVWQEQDWYWMLYTARDPSEHRRLGLARSSDGVHWTRVGSRAALEGNQPWNSAVVCDASVLPGKDGVRVWFGGGNRPEPAENLQGQIGYGVLRLRPGGE